MLIIHFLPIAKPKTLSKKFLNKSFFTRNMNTAEWHDEFPFKDLSDTSPLKEIIINTEKYRMLKVFREQHYFAHVK